MVSSVLKIYWLFIIQVFPHLLYLLALLLTIHWQIVEPCLSKMRISARD